MINISFKKVGKVSLSFEKEYDFYVFMNLISKEAPRNVVVSSQEDLEKLIVIGKTIGYPSYNLLFKSRGKLYKVVDYEVHIEQPVEVQLSNCINLSFGELETETPPPKRGRKKKL